MIMDFVMYFSCFLSGMFLGVMFFTIIENASKGFRQFVRKVCRKIPFLFRRIIMWVMIIILCFVGWRYFQTSTLYRGLISGALAGIFIYFKAGVTMGNNPDPYNKKSKNKNKNRMKKLKKR